MKHLKITVSGLVQGVYFRANTKDAADKLGVTGFCRNNPDGTVYIEAEGTEEQLKGFVAWCEQGPEMAKVDQLTVSEGTRQGFEGFEIRAEAGDNPYGSV